MKKLILFLLVSSLIVSCVKNPAETVFSESNLVFYAKTEGKASKTILDADGKVLWEPGDAIKLFYGYNCSYSAKLNAITDRPSSSTVFRGNTETPVSEPGTFYAIYPYREDYSFEANEFHIDLPSQQIAKPDSFNEELFISIAKSNNTYLNFFNACGGVCFTVNQEGIKTVSFSALNGYLSGKARLYFDNEGFPCISTTEDKCEVSLSAPEGETLIPGRRYFIVCYPAVLNSGYTMILSKEDGTQAIKQNPKPVSIKRATFGVLLNIDIGLDFKNIATQKEKEREALIAIYNAGDGGKWPDWMANWCTDAPVSEWGGVTTNELGLVNSLYLSNYHGSIPQEIGAFESLESLDILGEYTGQFPHEIAYLKNLKHLSIDPCYLGFDEPGLSGNIELDWSQLHSLEELRITGQNLSGSIPESIGYLKQLLSLNLSQNKLTGTIPSSLCELNRLKELNLSANQLSGALPDNLGQMSSLEFLNLKGHGDENYTNSFSGELPKSMANLNNLKDLNLAENKFAGTIPDFIWSLPSLETLNLSFNYFSGELTSVISNAKKLKSLNLCTNLLSGTLPDELWNLTDLMGIDISNYYEHYGVLLDYKNHFTGEIPSKISNLTELVEFTIGNNDFYGEIPESIINLSKLNVLKINNNNFTGCIPYGIADLPDLYIFWCQGNKLSGYLPKKIAERAGPFVSPWMVAPQQDGYDFEYDLYESSDYSRNKELITFQKATAGKGIDVVLMCDALVDSDINDGTYDRVMDLMYESLFEQEPFKSFKDCFNVYGIVLVSKNNNSEFGETALGIKGDPWSIYTINKDRILSLIHEVIPEIVDENNLTVSVATTIRSSALGCCAFYYNSTTEKGSGLGIACTYYGVADTDGDAFKNTHVHEVCGHGFGKLGDEYFYSNTTASEADISIIQDYHSLGWFGNIDITSVPEDIAWSSFLLNPYYINEGIGIYEGAYLRASGVWRPSFGSIMRSSYGNYFNAPSREIIYRRIHQISFGTTPSFEDFIQWDMAHPQEESSSHSVPRFSGMDNKTRLSDCILCK